MTTDKARKRAVRTRMTKTGERYAAARRHIVDPGPDPVAAEPTEAALPSPPASAATMPELPERVADPGMAEASLIKGTGLGWDHWLRLLDEWRATDHGHTEIARFLREDRGVDGWWAQTITVGWERARGRRAVHQTARGFEVSVSRTVGAPPDDVWDWFLDADRRRTWLDPGDLGDRRRSGPVGRSATFDVPDGTRVAIAVDPVGEGRSRVTATHAALPDATAIEPARAGWKARLERLAAAVAASV
jgi:hypothetical protein